MEHSPADLIKTLSGQVARIDPENGADYDSVLATLSALQSTLSEEHLKHCSLAAELVDSLSDGKASPAEPVIEQLRSIVAVLAESAGESPDGEQGGEDAISAQMEELLGDWPVEDTDLAIDFVEEAIDQFEQSDENLLILEQDPSDVEAIAAVFRAFHTVKGVAGFLDLKPISELAHSAETLLDEVRKGQRPFTGKVVDTTFQALDMLRELVTALSKCVSAGEPFRATANFPKTLNAVNHLLTTPKSIAVPQTPCEAEEPEANAGSFFDAPEADPATDAGLSEEPAESPAPSAPSSMEPVSAEKPDLDKPEAKTMQEQPRRAIKVDAEKIDSLLEGIGELVIAESILAQNKDLKSLKSRQLEHDLTHLGKIARQLQNAGMAMRLVSIDSTFQKMSRLVRDLGKKSQKQVELNMEGRDTEIDRGMVEKLGDPLVHMIRNSVDHGIEATAEERIAAGKPAKGQIDLRAFYKGGSVHITISDDGRGLNREKIARKAIERGMIQSADEMSDNEVYSLIFLPGFSTAAQVSDISGRGVGMDVVRRNIDGLRGRILIESELGKGSTFTIVLPLTMAIIDGMHVKIGKEVYIIPTLSVIESLKPVGNTISRVTNNQKMIRFRGQMLPLIYLSDVFNTENAHAEVDNIVVVVVEDTNRRIAFVVDELIGQYQTVIKNVSQAFGELPGISGACIMSDGRPGLIIDVEGITKSYSNNSKAMDAA